MNKSLILLMASALTLSLPAFAQDPAPVAEADASQPKFDMVIGNDEKPLSLGGGDARQVIGDAGQRNQSLYGEPMKKLWVPSISSWSAVDDQRLVLFVSPFRPYLLTLARKAPGLQNDRRVAFRFDNNHIYANFDRIEVDGFPYTIARIEKLDRETARALTRRDKGIDGPVPDVQETGDETDEPAPAEGEQSDS